MQAMYANKKISMRVNLDVGIKHDVDFNDFIFKLKVKTLQFHCSYFSFYKCFSFVGCQTTERIHIR